MLFYTRDTINTGGVKVTPHRPGRQSRINIALRAGDGRDSEIVAELMLLGKRGINAILNNSNGTDSRITDDVRVLVKVVKEFIAQDEEGMKATLIAKEGFHRIELLNATPLQYLVKLHNYLVETNAIGLAKEVERAIDRNPHAINYQKDSFHTKAYNTGVLLPNGVHEEGLMVSVRYIPR